MRRSSTLFSNMKGSQILPRSAQIASSIILLLLPFFLVELFLKKFQYDVSGLRRFVILRELDPNSRITSVINNSECSQSDTTNYVLRTDKDAYILPYSSLVKTKNVQAPIPGLDSLLFLGGSTTENLYVSENSAFQF